MSTENCEFPSYLKTSKCPRVRAWQLANSHQPFWNQTSPSRFVNFTFHFVPFEIVRKAISDKSTPYLLINFFGIHCRKMNLNINASFVNKHLQSIKLYSRCAVSTITRKINLVFLLFHCNLRITKWKLLWLYVTWNQVHRFSWTWSSINVNFFKNHK